MFRSDLKKRKGIPLKSKILTETPDVLRTPNFSPITALTITVCTKVFLSIPLNFMLATEFAVLNRA